MTLMSVPDFQNAFDPAHGLDFHKSRAYWLGRCSELVYPVTEEEKEADRKASEAKAAERALNPPWWKPWIRKVKTADCERARAEALAAVSRVVRTEALRVEADVRAWGFNRFQFLSGMSTQCFVAASDNVIVVCFRGTEVNRVGDIYDDLMAIPMRQAQVPGLIHIGFWNALKQVWRDIDTPQLVWPVDQDAESCKGLTDYLREFRNEVNPQLVWITGHSLGGALATMAAARLLGEEVLRPDEIGGVYTFGQPRVGDQMFADAYEIGARHFRVVHDNDVVTRVPPESLKRVLSAASMFVDVQPDQQENAQGLLNLQYSHVGHVAFLSGAAGIVVGLEKWQLLQRRIIARLMAIIRKGALVERLLPGLTDHSMSTYNNLIDADVTRSMLRSTPDERTSSASTLGRSMPDQNDSSLHAAPQNNSGSKLLAVFSGAGIGLLVGLLMGLSVSPTVGLVIGALASSLALILGLNDRYFTTAKAIRIGSFGFVCAAAALAGTYIRTHQLLSPSYESQKAEYIKLGYDKDEALDLIKSTRFGIRNPDWDPPEEKSFWRSLFGGRQNNSAQGSTASLTQNIHAGVLYGAQIDGDQCSMLRGETEAGVAGAFYTQGGLWVRLAVAVERDFGEDNAPPVLIAIRNGICGEEGTPAAKYENCDKLAGLTEQTSLQRGFEMFESSGTPWARVGKSVGDEIQSEDQKRALIILKENLCHDEKTG